MIVRRLRGILGDGLGMVMRNKRYIFWFWLLDLLLAWLGTAAFRDSARPILDNSPYSARLLHGFDLSVMFELYARPEFGSMAAVGTAAAFFAVLFFLMTALFLPGVFQGYASSYRLPRRRLLSRLRTQPVALHSTDDRRRNRDGNRSQESCLPQRRHR